MVRRLTVVQLSEFLERAFDSVLDAAVTAHAMLSVDAHDDTHTCPLLHSINDTTQALADAQTAMHVLLAHEATSDTGL